jgi:hypothetical protein
MIELPTEKQISVRTCLLILAYKKTLFNSTKLISNLQTIIKHTNRITMGVQDVLTRKSGVIVGDDVLALFEYAQKKNFAIPAIVCWFKIIAHTTF